MPNKLIHIVLMVLSLLTYKYQMLIPLGFFLVVLYFYNIQKILLLSKQINDENNINVTHDIKGLQKITSDVVSNINSLKHVIQRHDKKIKNNRTQS